jgi:hypothetical protein
MFAISLKAQEDTTSYLLPKSKYPGYEVEEDIPM